MGVNQDRITVLCLLNALMKCHRFDMEACLRIRCDTHQISSRLLGCLEPFSDCVGTVVSGPEHYRII
jgi:hypothetical protein